MARVEINEVVWRAVPGGQNMLLAALAGGASVQVNHRGGGAAEVFEHEEAGGLRPNPLTADAYGRVEGWVEPGSYHLVVSASGAAYTQPFEAVSGSSSGTGGPEADPVASAALAAHEAETTSAHNLAGLLGSKADLVGGVIPTSQVPAVATGQTVTVANQAAMLALAAAQVQPGDVAIRTDLSGRRFLLAAPDPSLLGSWIGLETPDAVSSVNGQQGAVTLGRGDVGLGQVDNTSDASKPVSTAQQAALDAKASEATRAASGKGSVNHGAAAGTARPAGYLSVEWRGSVIPSNAVDGDTWIDTA